MKTWRVPVSWTMMAMVDVEAKTLAEAIAIAGDKDGVIPIPDDGDYMDGSWHVDEDDVECVREVYNWGEHDEDVMTEN